MKFKDIIGHEKQKSLLESLVKKQQYANAYAFVGLPGIGKKQLALALTRAANCQSGAQGQAFCCDSCTSCLKIEKGNHPDIHILKPNEKTNTIKIEDVRELQHQLAYAPYEAKHRFFIIDDAHCLTTSAANALLKSLEEPAPHTSFILITPSAKKLLPTVISRCQKVSFSPLNTTEIEKFIQGNGLLARLAQGSIGRALNLADTLLSPQKRKNLLQNLNSSQSLEWAGSITSEDLNFLKTWYRDLYVYKTSKKVDDVVNFDLEDLLRDETKSLSEDQLIRKQEIVIEAENRLESNANRELTCEWLVLSLAGC